MTTFARGVAAPKRAVDSITFGRSVIDRKAIGDAIRSETRSATTADAAERRTIQREHAWVEAAAVAGMRITRF